MRPKSNDLRERIINQRLAGHSASEISSLFDVSIRSVQRYYRRYLERDCVSADRKGRREGSKLDARRDSISAWIKQTPGITLKELCERCEEHFDLRVHHTTMLRVLRRWGYRYKKNDLRKGTESP